MQNSASFNPKLPERLGPFRLVRQLGEGGTGIVCLGERTEQFTQKVAVKILHPQLFPAEAETSLLREARLLEALDHPGIVHMLDVGNSPENLRYIVMEYVDGLPFDAFCDGQSLPLRQRIEILIDICDAVEYAHRHLVIHADLKPENILITPEGKPRLLDFGVAGVLSEMGAQIAASVSYTPLYASPEQRAGERLTLASDIYTLGVMAQSLLGGVLPQPAAQSATRTVASKIFEQLAPDQQQIVARRRSTTPQSLVAALRGDIDAILARAMLPEPAERFASAAEFCEEWRRYLSGHPIQTRSASFALQLQKWALRNRLAASLACILMMAVALSALGVVWRAHETARRRQIAQTRLHELVRLTDVLAGELYDSVRGLPASEAAQKALLDSAHQTIGRLAITVEDDSQLTLELAREYEKLARIELSRRPLGEEARQQAAGDIRQAGALLQRLPARDSEAAQIRQELAALSK